MLTRRPLSSGRIALTAGLITVLATLGLASPLPAATAQTNSRVCGAFWYTQVPDPTNDDKPTWFTLGVTEEIKKSDHCGEGNHKWGDTPDLVTFWNTFPDLPRAFGGGEQWEFREIDKVTCEDFATHIAQPPNGEEILDRGQNWPADDPDPCQSWDRNALNSFWFKHL